MERRKNDVVFSHSVLVLGVLSSCAVYADTLYVAIPFTGTIGAYSTTGATLNASLLSGLPGPYSVAASGSSLFVAQDGNGTFTGSVGEYAMSGATVNAALVPPGLGLPTAITVSGSNIYVASLNSNSVSKYTTSGVLVNP